MKKIICLFFCLLFLLACTSNIPNFQKPEWVLKGNRCDWVKYRGTSKEYKEGTYAHYENKNGKATGAEAAMFESKEIALKWIWPEGPSGPVRTFLLLESGKWVKGKPGIYAFQHHNEIWENGKIKGEKVILEGSDGKIYQRIFPALEAQILWWYDDDHLYCQKGEFKGMYMYKGLHTFDTEKECEDFLRNREEKK